MFRRDGFARRRKEQRFLRKGRGSPLFLLSRIFFLSLFVSSASRAQDPRALLAIGMERGQIRMLFLLEGLLLGVVGSAVGAAASFLLRLVLNASGIMLPAPPGGTRGNILHVDFIPLAYGLGFAIMALTLLIAAWWPARRAARLNPVEALGHV